MRTSAKQYLILIGPNVHIHKNHSTANQITFGLISNKNSNIHQIAFQTPTKRFTSANNTSVYTLNKKNQNKFVIIAMASD